MAVGLAVPGERLGGWIVCWRIAICHWLHNCAARWPAQLTRQSCLTATLWHPIRQEALLPFLADAGAAVEGAKGVDALLSALMSCWISLRWQRVRRGTEWLHYLL